MLHLAEAEGDNLVPHRSVWVYSDVNEKLKALRQELPGVNINRMWNIAMLQYITEIEGVEEVLRLEAEVDVLVRKLDRVHQDGKALLRHGSYASAYVKELKGLDVRRVVSDLPPYNSRNTRPALTEKELALVEKMVVFRRAIAEELWEKLDRLMNLKSEGLDPGLVDRVRQSLKVSDISWQALRVPECVDDLVKLPPGKGRSLPEDLYRMRVRSGDPVIDGALRRAWAVEEEVKRKYETADTDEEAEDE